MANLFADGFESGDLTAWSSAFTDGGDLSAHADAKLHGSYGLKCVIDDTTNIYVEDDTPNNEKRYRVRFYFNTNSLSMGDYDNFRPLYAGPLYIQLRYRTGLGTYQIFPIVKNDNNAEVSGTITNISNARHCIEVDYVVSSAPGANDGSFSWWLDGAFIETQSGIDNDTKVITMVWLGTFSITANVSGTFFLDDYASNNDGSEIGLLHKWNAATITKWNGKLIKKWNGI